MEGAEPVRDCSHVRKEATKKRWDLYTKNDPWLWYDGQRVYFSRDCAASLRLCMLTPSPEKSRKSVLTVDVNRWNLGREKNKKNVSGKWELIAPIALSSEAPQNPQKWQQSGKHHWYSFIHSEILYTTSPPLLNGLKIKLIKPKLTKFKAIRNNPLHQNNNKKQT